MKLTEMFESQLKDEAGRTRRALERMPEGQDDWKPHERSMPLGRLAMLVARMPSWLDLIINRDELDLKSARWFEYQPDASAYAGRAGEGTRRRRCQSTQRARRRQ